MIAQYGTLEISRSRLRHNLQLLQQRAGSAQLCPVIKANAYGHGIAEILPLLQAEGLDWLAVYSLDEAMAIAGPAFKILALAPTVVAPENGGVPNLREIFTRNIRLNITDYQSALRLSMLADHFLWSGGRLRIHMQVDTGLTRAGVPPADAPALANAISTFPSLSLEGIFAHFSHGDVPNHPTIAQQLQTLQSIAQPFKKQNPTLLIHAQNSGGTFHLGDAGLDMVRIGIALYGLQPSTTHPIPNLQPIARLTAPILAIHDRPTNTGIGYGHTFITTRPSRLAIVPVGYADGYPRALSNNCVAQIRDTDVPVVGRVSMDQIILDITDLPDTIAPGEPVTVISDNPAQPNSLDRMADTLHTISYELATHLGSRLRRTIVE